MRTSFWLFLSGLFALAVPGWAADEPKTFAESYKASLIRSETLADQVELVRQAEEKYNQAIGSVVPQLTAYGSYLLRDSGGSNLSGSISPTSQPLARITASQVLFRGFREFAGLRQTTRLVESQRETRRRAATLLYVDVAESFETVLIGESERRNLDSQADLTRKRIGELKERARIGRSRGSEVLEVEVSLASLEAQRDALGAQIAAAREAWAFLTGFPSTTSLKDEGGKDAAAAPAALDTYLARVAERPEVLAASREVEAADEGTAIARGAHLPSVDIAGNYYLKRTGVLEDAKWDVQVTASLPLFSGGVIQSQVRTARSQLTQAELGRERLKREAEREIRTLHETLVADRAQVAGLERAAALSQKNFEEQTREYRLGLVTNLTVLAALTSSQEILRSLDRARRTSHVDRVRLEAAAALRPRPDEGPAEKDGDGSL